MMVLMDSPLRLFFVSWFLAAAWADIDENVCLPLQRSCGPVLPVLPINFEMKGEFIDRENKSLNYEEIYYDFDNLRGKYVLLSEGIELHLLFDYNASQIIEYFVVHPGSSIKDDPLAYRCSAVELEYSEHRSIFGYRYDSKNVQMYDSSHVLRFGGPYQYAYNGSSGGVDKGDGSSSDDTEDDGRGLLWDAFIGCIYEREKELTALVRYKFSGANLLTPSGSVKGDVDGTGRNDSLPVPIAVDYTGSAIKTDSVSGKRSYVKIDASQSISWFKANPTFDNKNFLIPTWIHCDKYRGWKSLPNLPMAFSVRLELIAYPQDELGKRIAAELVTMDQLYYYNEKGLARRDFTPHVEMDNDIIKKFGNPGPVKTIFDYTTLQVYTISKSTGRCFTRILQLHEYFSTTEDTPYRVMGTPEELFLLQQEDMEYKGQYFTRDIECDVWSGKFFDPELNMTFVKETYMSTNGWHFDADEKVEYGVPVKHSVIVNSKAGEFVRSVAEENFFKFKAYPPILRTFDISECVETIEHKFFAIKLLVPEGDPQTTLETYKFVFLESAQYYLASVSDLASPLRIQRIALSISKIGVLLTFAIVEKPNGDDILNPTKGANVEDAAAKLKSVVDEGNFEIIFVHPETKEKIPIVAEAGNFFNWYPGGNITATKIREPSSRKYDRPHPHSVFEHTMEEEKNLLHDVTATETPKAQKQGMSSGALGGLSVAMLIIGIAIGVAVMYLYIRKYGGSSGNDDYVMHPTG